MNPQEARKQKFDHLKKKALMVLTTALRVPLMLMMGCGYVDFNGKRHSLNDHNGKLTVLLLDVGSKTELYDEAKHGPIIEFLEEGERIPDSLNNKHGQTPIHRHHRKSSGGYAGVHEFQYE
ncbi:hypothetical protein HZA75_04390 [Candidatus Roizmanbacteria bacterium]|nr:hypothetical protein [Candidatus Roizmanbacteria bacterium]